MRQRIHHLTGDNDTGYINAFHGFCVSILQEDSHTLQYPKSFLLLDNGDIIRKRNVLDWTTMTLSNSPCTSLRNTRRSG